MATILFDPFSGNLTVGGSGGGGGGPITITDTFVVNSEAEMLALTVQRGDVAVRTDISKTFILKEDDPTILASWVELLTPPDLIQSVNGQVGTVVLNTDDVAEGTTNQYFTELRARDATVSDSIIDGITNVAPSQNAVYDALGLKYDASNPDGFVDAAGAAAAAPVQSVNTQTGDVVLDTDDVAEGTTNLYYTETRFDTAFGTKTTDDLDEGLTNLYYTDSRAKAATVADSIVDGVTDVAPSQNAVYDALQAIQLTTDAYHEIQKEPTGFVDRTSSSISFDDVSRTISIQPTGLSFDVYVKGKKYTKTTLETFTIPNTSGNHYIHYNSDGSLDSTQVIDSTLFTDNAMVSIVYWNTDTSTHTYFAEERHGLVMDGATHSYLHTTFGSRYASGLALQNFVVDGDGTLNTQAQFTADSGSIKDEDIVLTLAAQTQIPVLYRQGQLWRKKAANGFPLIYSGTAGYTGANGRIPYNQYTGGAWQLTEANNSAYVLVHIFATNDKDNSIVGIQGTSQHTSISDARNAASSEISSLSGLPFAEFVAIGSVIFNTASSFSNTPKAVVTSINVGGTAYMDFRGTQLYTPAGTATTHGLLSGLSNDDHPQYLTEARGDARYSLISSGSINETTFNAANNQSSAANVTGLAFNNLTVRSFKVLLSIAIDATIGLFEAYELLGIQNSSGWSMTASSVGDNSGIVFSITSTGQVQYTSTNVSGWVSTTMKFKADTTVK